MAQRRHETKIKKWESFAAYGFRVDPLEGGEQIHVSMVRESFDPRQPIGA
jgi:hypothetical protein